MACDQDDSGEPRRGRPRHPEVDERIRTAAFELLCGGGPGAVTIDAVASHSGVARTTIYRRYSSREELLATILDEIVDVSFAPPDESLEGQVRWALERARVLLEEGLGRGGTAAVLADSDPEFTDALQRRLHRALHSLREQIGRGVASGHLAADVDPDALVGAVFGAYLAEVLQYSAPRPGWEDRTVALLLAGIAPTGEPQREARPAIWHGERHACCLVRDVCRDAAVRMRWLRLR
jgi:AcrR family transcriptional regulator